jgi:predicted XRE-type DNA-binding protein
MNTTSVNHDYVESSGNVFADMGLEEADELLTRAQLGYSVRQILHQERDLKQREIAELLDINQPEVSNLMQGKYYLFSEGRLFGFLNKLNKKVIIHILQHYEDEPFQQVTI